MAAGPQGGDADGGSTLCPAPAVRAEARVTSVQNPIAIPSLRHSPARAPWRFEPAATPELSHMIEAIHRSAENILSARLRPSKI